MATSLRTIAYEWIDAFNRHDIERLLGLYSDDAAHYSPEMERVKPETGGWLEGKAQLREWWQHKFDELPDLHYDLMTITAGETKVFMEYERKVLGQESRHVMEYLYIENGIITESRVLRSWPLL